MADVSVVMLCLYLRLPASDINLFNKFSQNEKKFFGIWKSQNRTGRNR